MTETQTSTAIAAASLDELLNDSYNEATRATIEANDAVRAAESALYCAQGTAAAAEKSRQAIIAVIKAVQS
jgi:hypothetical protein